MIQRSDNVCNSPVTYKKIPIGTQLGKNVIKLLYYRLYRSGLLRLKVFSFSVSNLISVVERWRTFLKWRINFLNSHDDRTNETDDFRNTKKGYKATFDKQKHDRNDGEISV